MSSASDPAQRATSALASKLQSGTFVVTTELTPPKGIDLGELFARAEIVKPHVDAVNLTESPRARMAIEPTAVAHLLLDRGVEPIVQFTARDRNRIALQSDLLGAAALGVGNFVFMTGDSPAHGDHPDAKGVFDLYASDMLRAAHALMAGHDLAGHPLKGAPRLCVGATANPGAVDFQAEVDNTRRKIDAGAHFLQTQAIYDVALLERFIEALRPQSVAILAGVIPLKSARMAAWLHDNVPGIRVPDALLDEMQVAAASGAEPETGLAIAARIVRAARPLCAGVHLMTLGWEQHIAQILHASGVR
ncbi:MAG TPA: methylenetetrahydrofolate reductase [Steroidobacteraceae bacterium]|nr:methylenetetrahydrofolate reductase [Steroidobacteraceae bacterium]